eukprot:2451628-Prymnesium_polylepis.1
MRTHSEQNASFHIIGSPLETSWAAGRLPNSPCDANASHSARVAALSAALGKLTSFRASRGRNFVLGISNHFVQQILGNALFAQFAAGPMVLLTTDHDMVEVANISGLVQVVM